MSASLTRDGSPQASSDGELLYLSSEGFFGDAVAGNASFDLGLGDPGTPELVGFTLGTIGGSPFFDLGDVPFVPDVADFSSFVFSIYVDGIFANQGNIFDNNPEPVSISVVSVPEPFTLSLMGAGLIGIGVLRRRRRTA